MQQLKQLQEIFEFQYGNSLSLNKMDICSFEDEYEEGETVSFVSRTAKNNGVSATVKLIDGVEPFSAGLITTALSGSVMESFVQPVPFYTGFHVMVLTPIKTMSLGEKLFYCICMRKNKYRFSYGRQANRTIKEIYVPATPPEWVNEPISLKAQSRALGVSIQVNSST